MGMLDNYAERWNHDCLTIIFTSHSLQLRVKFMCIYVMWMFWSFLLITSASLPTWNNFIAVYWYWIREHTFFTHHNWNTYARSLLPHSITLIHYCDVVYTMMNIQYTACSTCLWKCFSVLLLFTNRRAWKFFQTQSSHKHYSFIR